MFTPDEDQRLLMLRNRYGSDWKLISVGMRTRSARQCRERYRNYLNPKRKAAAWEAHEDLVILERYRERGMQWAEIAQLLPGRTPVDVRNRWTVLWRRELGNMPWDELPRPEPRVDIEGPDSYPDFGFYQDGDGVQNDWLPELFDFHFV
jgi:hypothetical protein